MMPLEVPEWFNDESTPTSLRLHRLWNEWWKIKGGRAQSLSGVFCRCPEVKAAQESIVGETGDLGFPEGTAFASRVEARACCMHYEVMRGIHINKETGRCLSIVISGGYEDDVDFGHCVVYTAEGGDRRQQVANQANNHQMLTEGNRGLVEAMAHGTPVRVMRGRTGRHDTNCYPPESGYRYDGLYKVEDAWHQRQPGRTRDSRIWRFLLRYIPGKEAWEARHGVPQPQPTIGLGDIKWAKVYLQVTPRELVPMVTDEPSQVEPPPPPPPPPEEPSMEPPPTTNSDDTSQVGPPPPPPPPPPEEPSMEPPPTTNIDDTSQAAPTFAEPTTTPGEHPQPVEPAPKPLSPTQGTAVASEPPQQEKLSMEPIPADSPQVEPPPKPFSTTQHTPVVTVEEPPSPEEPSMEPTTTTNSDDTSQAPLCVPTPPTGAAVDPQQAPLCVPTPPTGAAVDPQQVVPCEATPIPSAEATFADPPQDGEPTVMLVGWIKVTIIDTWDTVAQGVRDTLAGTRSDDPNADSSSSSSNASDGDSDSSHEPRPKRRCTVVEPPEAVEQAVIIPNQWCQLDGTMFRIVPHGTQVDGVCEVWINGLPRLDHMRPFTRLGREPDANYLVWRAPGRTASREDLSCGREPFPIPVEGPEGQHPMMVYTPANVSLQDADGVERVRGMPNPRGFYDEGPTLKLWHAAGNTGGMDEYIDAMVDPFVWCGELRKWLFKGPYPPLHQYYVQRDKNVVQSSVQHRVTAVHAGAMGWGLRVDEAVKCGEFMMPYSGELIGDCETAKRSCLAEATGDSKLFNATEALAHVQTTEFIPVVDAAGLGNVGCLVNHSCSPNLQMVTFWLEGHRDPILALFARVDIPSGTVLGLDYGWKWDRTVQDVPCRCGSDACHQWLHYVGRPAPEPVGVEA